MPIYGTGIRALCYYIIPIGRVKSFKTVRSLAPLFVPENPKRYYYY